MGEVLFLAHRIPYPPDKGDKIRSWHLLSHLCRHHNVHLGCLIDDPEDVQHLPALESICASLHAERLRPGLHKLLALRALVTGEALTFPYFRHQDLQRWVDKRLIDHPPDLAIAYSSAMGPYLTKATARTRRIIDLVDLDSRKWHDYADRRQGVRRWLYRREGRALASAEQTMIRDAALSLFISSAETEELLGLAPSLRDKVAAVGNGVDEAYFDPTIERSVPDPRLGEGPAVVFTGAMDYWANIEGVTWFSSEVWPALKSRSPEARFFIVGARPAPTVQQLADDGQGIVVTGRVSDIRPWLTHATVAVAPLRIARGVQNKVLEAMAMAKAVICTAAANTGIDGRDGVELVLADSPEAQLAQLTDLLLDSDRRKILGRAARAHILDRFRWSIKLAQFDRLLLHES